MTPEELKEIEERLHKRLHDKNVRQYIGDVCGDCGADEDQEHGADCVINNGLALLAEVKRLKELLERLRVSQHGLSECGHGGILND